MESVRTHIQWAKQGEAIVVRVAGDAIVLRSSVPSPPGSRIEGDVIATSDAHPAEVSSRLRVKIHVSKRQEDGAFVLEGRLLDATRELRERLVALVGA